MDHFNEAHSIIRKHFAKHIIATQRFRGQETLLIAREALAKVALFLRNEALLSFDVLMDLTCVDYLKFGKSQASHPALATPSPLPYYMEPKPTDEPWRRGVENASFRFEVVYHLYSTAHNNRLRLKVPLPEREASLESVASIWKAADWFEREVWDMFGVTFAGHPNLKRILMYEGFEGHPLRKDYPTRRRQPLVGPAN